MSDWWMYENSGPLPSRDGIPARSRRGEIGETWWSRRFIAALREVTDPSRLTRGRSYARGGQVMDLRVAPGVVTAEVQGSRAAPYRVRITLPPFTDAEWERVERALAGQALFLAALLAGEMPQGVEEVFRAEGLSLFPSRPEELGSECTCPDPVNPCKHIAATLYILAEAFDADPFLVLAWRGRPRERLLERLRELRGAAPEAAAGDAAPAEEAEARRTGGFWNAGPELAALHFAPRAAEVPDAVLRQLGPLPRVAGTERIAEALAGAYRAFTAAAERRAFGDGAAAPGDAPEG
ncbi:MAG TPA: hypothetical protein VF615_04320 [Longimicrobiaceae bacterium]|jgi:uncharacterized Zn finger protein